MRLPRLFYSKIFLSVILLILAGVFFLELQQWRERRAINNEIDHLVAEQKALEQKNLDLENSLQYFSSDPYKEKLAREQLGLQKDGEIVVNFPRLAEQVQTQSQTAPKETNPQKWWKYLFY